MRLDLIAETPVVVTVPGLNGAPDERWRVPPFSVYDYLDWAKREDGAITDAACSGMSPDAKWQYVSAYGQVTRTPIEELRPLVKQEGGAAVVCGTCLQRAVVIERGGTPTKDEPVRYPRAMEVARTMSGACRLALAAMLCPEPPEEKKKEKPAAEPGEKDDAGAGPLPVTPSGASAA